MPEVKTDYAAVEVTGSPQQAARVSDPADFLCPEKLIEEEETVEVFGRPRENLT
ncbi:MAG: hypothetical protein L3K02_08880 [Thermoplasmata archaeon]|nr:hypothetical protein [Thermoplasmata archaeon]